MLLPENNTLVGCAQVLVPYICYCPQHLKIYSTCNQTMPHTVDRKGYWRESLVLFGYDLLNTDFKMCVLNTV